MPLWLERIRAMKKASGLTTFEIAERSGIPEPTLEKIFAGTTKAPKLTTMQELVHFFGYTLDDLTEQKEKAPNPPEVPVDRDLEMTKDRLREPFYDFIRSLGWMANGEDLTEKQEQALSIIMDVIKLAREDGGR